VAVEYFSFDSAKAEAFVRFGYDMYHGDAKQIPQMKKEMYIQFLPDFIFYQRPENCHRHFLATAGGKIVGRISAMFNHDLKEIDGTPVGTIGFFECVNDFGVARDLLDCSTKWLREERGICRIWGPMNFDIWHGYRLMTKGFDQKPFYGEPYNQAYYPGFFEKYGFIAKYFWDSAEITGRKILKKIVAFGEQRHKYLLNKGYRFKRLNRRQFMDNLDNLHSVLTRSFKGFTGFTPISLKEFRRLFEKTRYAFHPELFTFIYDEKDVIAGFALALLELSDAVRSMNGRDNLLSIMKFFNYRRRAKRINFYLIGITPEEEKKKSGLGRAIAYFMIHQILNQGYETVIFSLMARKNRAQKLLGDHTQEANREYALFELNL
jgi:hypothetical protein